MNELTKVQVECSSRCWWMGAILLLSHRRTRQRRPFINVIYPFLSRRQLVVITRPLTHQLWTFWLKYASAFPSAFLLFPKSTASDSYDDVPVEILTIISDILVECFDSVFLCSHCLLFFWLIFIEFIDFENIEHCNWISIEMVMVFDKKS